MSATATYLSVVVNDGVTGPDGDLGDIEVTASVGEFDGLLLECKIPAPIDGQYMMMVLDSDATVALINALTQTLAVWRGRGAV